jgi:hypothetical protein
MPACPYGAEPKPGFEGIVRWLEDQDFPAEVLTLVRLLEDLTAPYTTTQLIDVDRLCAENLSPPEPITLPEIAAWTRFGGGVGLQPDPTFIQKVISYAKYQVFLNNCVCKAAPTTPGNNCTDAPSSFVLGSLGSIAGPFPITVDQELLDSIFVHPNGDWDWSYRGSAVIDGGAHNGDNLEVQYLASNGQWVAGPDLLTLNSLGGNCGFAQYLAATPRFGTSSAARIVNNAGGTHTIVGFEFCFCPLAVQPTPLPPQPPITNVPAPPTILCDNDTLCVLVQDLARRLTTIGAQVSDLQALLLTTSVLTVLSQTPISGEGELELALGTRAVSVELTALSDDAYTSALGRPRGLMRVGSLRWGDGVGYSPRRFIDADRYDETRPAGALSISWQLLPNAQALLKFLG